MKKLLICLLATLLALSVLLGAVAEEAASVFDVGQYSLDELR